jgi:hypothetical protein
VECRSSSELRHEARCNLPFATMASHRSCEISGEAASASAPTRDCADLLVGHIGANPQFSDRDSRAKNGRPHARCKRARARAGAALTLPRLKSPTLSAIPDVVRRVMPFWSDSPQKRGCLACSHALCRLGVIAGRENQPAFIGLRVETAGWFACLGIPNFRLSIACGLKPVAAAATGGREAARQFYRVSILAGSLRAAIPTAR